ncbi:hypothetical protein ACFL43_04880 [Thermodesulfobacteriota bacterium]
MVRLMVLLLRGMLFALLLTQCGAALLRMPLPVVHAAQAPQVSAQPSFANSSLCSFFTEGSMWRYLRRMYTFENGRVSLLVGGRVVASALTPLQALPAPGYYRPGIVRRPQVPLIARGSIAGDRSPLPMFPLLAISGSTQTRMPSVQIFMLHLFRQDAP